MLINIVNNFINKKGYNIKFSIKHIIKSRKMSQSSGNEKYSNLTKEQLIEKLLFYESKLQEITLNSTLQIPAKKLDKKKKKTSARPFDWSKYSKRHIALKIAYFGWNYHGFASQGNEEDFPTV